MKVIYPVDDGIPVLEENGIGTVQFNGF